MFKDYKYTVAERFLRYVKIDTQSDPESPTNPSTEKQKNLGKVLVAELLQMGISDAHLDEYGYVYATIEANTNKEVPVICFCSHMDTSPDCSGANVNPILHENYNGGIIHYSTDTSLSLNPEAHTDLKNQVGNTIITTDGSTLLGADNKAGLAEIMDAANFLIQNPQIKHGKIRILFTPDEEIGRGVDKVDMQKLGADFGYTMDGESAGHIEDETFSADGGVLTIKGVSTHPGFAKGKMESAIKIAGDILAALPKNRLSPETTEKKEGFVHPTSVNGQIEEAVIKFIIRGFDNQTLIDNANEIRKVADTILLGYPNSSYSLVVSEQYRNMKEILLNYPQVVDYAKEAILRTGLIPITESIRGGTDGSRLSFMGLPCPNIFAGEHAFHSKLEWVSIEDMQKAVESIVHISMIWEEKS